MTKPGLDIDWIARPCEAGALAEACAFARAELFDRAALHADLEDPRLRAKSRFLVARRQGRLVGAASLLEGVLSKTALALGADSAAAAEALVRAVERPFWAMAPERFWPPLARAGGRSDYVDLLMVRLRPDALPAPDPRVERITGIEELRGFSSHTIAGEHLECGPYFGLRDRDGALAAIGGVHYVTDRLACLARIETRPERRRQGLARALVIELIRALETPKRTVLLQVEETNAAAIALYSELGFRGVRRMGFFDFA